MMTCIGCYLNEYYSRIYQPSLESGIRTCLIESCKGKKQNLLHLFLKLHKAKQPKTLKVKRFLCH